MLPSVHIFDEMGDYVFVSWPPVSQMSTDINRPGRWTMRCIIPGNILNTGSFTVGLGLAAINTTMEVAFLDRSCLAFQVSEVFDEEAETIRSGYAGPVPGPVRPICAWDVADVNLSE
jgi:hypothetical protein